MAGIDMRMGKTIGMMMIFFALAVCSGCTRRQESVKPVERTAAPTATTAPDSEEKAAALREQEEIVEAIAVGEYQVALRQEQDSGKLEFVLYQEEQERVLAAIGEYFDITNCHIEPFAGEILGYEGFYLYKKDGNEPFSYVYYVGLRDGKDKILFVNNASYHRKKDRFEASFDEVRDVDGDRIREVISNILYVADGGMDAVIYDCDQRGRILSGSLCDLLDCDYYMDRYSDLAVWYRSKHRKVWITFYPSERAKYQEKKEVIKKYNLNKKNLKKVKMRKDVVLYDSLKEMENYYE